METKGAFIRLRPTGSILPETSSDVVIVVIGATGKHSEFFFIYPTTNLLISTNVGIGKSSLINVLLDSPILPEGNSAYSTTCVPIKISRAATASFSACVQYNSKDPVKYPNLSALQLRRNLLDWQRGQDVKSIAITGPVDLPPKMSFIDMPGFLDVENDLVQARKALLELIKPKGAAQTLIHVWTVFPSRLTARQYQVRLHIFL